MTNVDYIYAYIAGFMDGEGCFGICIQRPTPNNRRKYTFYCARAMIINTNRDVLEFVKSYFGGSINVRKKIKNRKQIYTWVIHGEKMDFFCKSILPFLIVKKQQCEVIIDYYKTVDYPRFNISPEERQRREELFLLLKSLNKVGDKE